MLWWFLSLRNIFVSSETEKGKLKALEQSLWSRSLGFQPITKQFPILGQELQKISWRTTREFPLGQIIEASPLQISFWKKNKQYILVFRLDGLLREGRRVLLLDRQDRGFVRPGVGLPIPTQERYRPWEPLREGPHLRVKLSFAGIFYVVEIQIVWYTKIEYFIAFCGFFFSLGFDGSSNNCCVNAMASYNDSLGLKNYVFGYLTDFYYFLFTAWIPLSLSWNDCNFLIIISKYWKNYSFVAHCDSWSKWLQIWLFCWHKQHILLAAYRTVGPFWSWLNPFFCLLFTKKPW